VERHHLGVTRNALRENRLVIFGLCSIGLRRHGPFISCHIFLPLCFALSGTHLGSSFFTFKISPLHLTTEVLFISCWSLPLKTGAPEEVESRRVGGARGRRGGSRRGRGCRSASASEAVQGEDGEPTGKRLGWEDDGEKKGLKGG